MQNDQEITWPDYSRPTRTEPSGTQYTEEREKILMECYLRSAVTCRKDLDPKTAVAMVQVSLDFLREIPTHELCQAFYNYHQSATTDRMPTDRQLITAWKNWKETEAKGFNRVMRKLEDHEVYALRKRLCQEYPGVKEYFNDPELLNSGLDEIPSTLLDRKFWKVMKREFGIGRN